VFLVLFVSVQVLWRRLPVHLSGLATRGTVRWLLARRAREIPLRKLSPRVVHNRLWIPVDLWRKVPLDTQLQPLTSNRGSQDLDLRAKCHGLWGLHRPDGVRMVGRRQDPRSWIGKPRSGKCEVDEAGYLGLANGGTDAAGPSIKHRV